MGKKKVIILYSTGGMGHKKAAIAIYDALLNRGRAVDAEIIDVLDYATPFYRFAYMKGYVFLMSSGRWLWGALYYFTNNRLVDALTRRMREFLDNRNFPGLSGMIIDRAPDAVIATHFVLPSIAGVFKRDKSFRSRLYTVITDYGPHAYWLSPDMNRFFVGSDSVAQELSKVGIPGDKIAVTGIPTVEEFGRRFDLEKLRGNYGLEKGKKTIFLMSGGFGVGPIGRMLLSLNKCRAGTIQVITVCGHNEAVYEKIVLLKKDLNYPLVLFGFTDKVAELMAVSDLMITKAGGISVTEALDSRLPMILFASVPGQETWNERLLTACGAAVKAKKVSDLPVIADRILFSGNVTENMKASIDKVRRPDAAERIVDIVLEEVGE